MPDDKASKWSFTAWSKPCSDDPRITYMCWGKETTQAGQVHYQSYCELDKEYSLPWVKRILKTKDIHLEPAKKDRLINLSYCLKSAGCENYTLDRARPKDEPELDWADQLANHKFIKNILE